ncbi:MAG: PIN domain-containing protein [Pseudacidovorax sp.]|nr:PIN domain-containing protein [Pseudacidovorax sp.]
MMMVDSSVWIDFFRNRETAQTTALRSLMEGNEDQLVLLDLVLMEVLRGFAHDREWRLAREALAALPIATAGGEAVALRAADIYRQQRRRGITVCSPVDLMVAAWCVEHGCALLHGDRDFDGIDGLNGWKN